MRSPGRPPVDRREIQQRFLRKISEGLSHRPLEPEQYTAIRFTQRLADAGIQPSMGSVGDSFDTQSRICDEGCRLVGLTRHSSGLRERSGWSAA
jgi:hypothetical protein